MPISGIVLVVWWFCFCFLSGFSEGVLDECCISYWHAWLCVHGGMLAAVQSRVKGRSGGENFRNLQEWRRGREVVPSVLFQC